MSLNRWASTGFLTLALWPLMACQEELPTAHEQGGLIPVSATTVEVRLPFEEFASNLRVYGGYGSPSELLHGIVAHEYEGVLESRTLLGWWPFPVSASVRDTTGTARADSSLTFVGAKVVVHIDTLTSIHDGPVDFAAGAIQDSWHYSTTSWEMAVDSIGDHKEWSEPGGGPVVPLSVATWDPTEGDSVVFELDSAEVALWSDTLSAAKGMRLDALTEGVWLKVHTFRIYLSTRPSSNPDTLVDLQVQNRFRSFIYEPVISETGDDFRVGGVPAWRTVFDIDVPTTLNGPAELCALVDCPLTLEPKAVNSAALLFRTAESPPGFRPTDSLRVDVRPVLEPDRLPKSPLGAAVTGVYGINLPPEAFADSAGTLVEIPLRSFIADQIRGQTLWGTEVPGTLAVLSSFEPLSLHFGSFHGPGGPDAPQLRLIVTVGEGVEIR